MELNMNRILIIKKSTAPAKMGHAYIPATVRQVLDFIWLDFDTSNLLSILFILLYPKSHISNRVTLFIDTVADIIGKQNH